MYKDDLDLIVESLYEPPTGWDKGFSEKSGLMLKTDEVPFQVQGKWFLYVWYTEKEPKEEVVYSFKDDMIYSYDQFHDWLDQIDKAEYKETFQK